MKNVGKTFEDNFRKSVPSDAWYYRFKDGTANWSGGFNTNVRFQASNIADNLIYYNGKLFINELKHHYGKSIPLSCIEGNKGKEKQIKEMLEARVFHNVKSTIIVFFSDVEECYALDIIKYEEFKRQNYR